MSYQLFKLAGGGQVWHYRFQVAGARTQRSTRETVKRRADQVAAKAYDEAVIRANGGQPVPVLSDLVADWLLMHAPIASANHLRSVETWSRLHMYDLAALRVDQITTAEVERARIKHLETHSHASANHWLRILKLVCNWAVKRKELPAIGFHVAMIKVQKRPRSILPADVAQEWFAAVDKAAMRSPSIATAIRLMFGLGLRAGEAAGARWEWIDWERNTYTPGETKGREAEPVPMGQWLVDHLLSVGRQSDGLIAPKDDGTQHPEGFARSTMIVANARCKTKGITPHRLRGTFATMLSEAGVPIQTIQRVMRHKSPMTTMGYLEKNLAAAADAQAVIAAKAGFKGREIGEQQPGQPSTTGTT